MLHHDYQCMKHRSTQVTVMAPMWAAYTPLFSAISLDVLSWTETWRPLHGKRLSRLGMPLPTILGWICCLMVCTFKLFGFGQLFFLNLWVNQWVVVIGVVGICFFWCHKHCDCLPQTSWYCGWDVFSTIVHLRDVLLPWYSRKHLWCQIPWAMMNVEV